MNILQIKDGKVIYILKGRNDTSIENLRVVDEIPQAERKQGYIPVLMYSDEQGVYWDYKEIPTSSSSSNMTVEEKAAAYDILTGASE